MQWFNSYGHFTKGLDFAYRWSCIRKDLRLQPAQQACLNPALALIRVLLNFIIFYQESVCFLHPGQLPLLALGLHAANMAVMAVARKYVKVSLLGVILAFFTLFIMSNICE